MRRINIYFREEQPKDHFFKGDRYLISSIKRVLRKKKISGIEKVFVNLCKGLDQLKVNYAVNLPFKKIGPNEPVVVLGTGKYALEGYHQPNPIIAGIGLMTHPFEWPGLFNDYPVVKYLQHSQWTNEIYVRFYGKDKCEVWPSGIDAEQWAPDKKISKKIDFLIYNKIMWDSDQMYAELRNPVLDKLDQLGLTYKEVVYGRYIENDYFKLLQECSAMIFLCEHESQGFACCEALSMNVPVFAWDQGYWLDPNRFKWGDPVVPATSIPFFDERCGMSFKDFNDFEKNISSFWNKVKEGYFNPRAYLLENLTLKKSAERMLEIINSIYK